jgi:dTDP-glucose 4,6-dehydratase
MNSDKTRSLGWAPQADFESELVKTVAWYKENEWWWRPITQREDYREFVAQFYGKYLGEDL